MLIIPTYIPNLGALMTFLTSSLRFNGFFVVWKLGERDCSVPYSAYEEPFLERMNPDYSQKRYSLAFLLCLSISRTVVSR